MPQNSSNIWHLNSVLFQTNISFQAGTNGVISPNHMETPQVLYKKTPNIVFFCWFLLKFYVLRGLVTYFSFRPICRFFRDFCQVIFRAPRLRFLRRGWLFSSATYRSTLYLCTNTSSGKNTNTIKIQTQIQMQLQLQRQISCWLFSFATYWCIAHSFKRVYVQIQHL